MAPLVGIAAHLRAVAVEHVAFQLMDRRRLRSPQRLMVVTVEAADFEIAVTGVERVAEGR